MNEIVKEEIAENIKRLEATIQMNSWNKGYVENCKSQIESYRDQLKVKEINYRKEILKYFTHGDNLTDDHKLFGGIIIMAIGYKNIVLTKNGEIFDRLTLEQFHHDYLT